MGQSKGAWTVYESLRIELPFLLKMRYIEKGYVKSFTLAWHDQHRRHTGSMGCTSSYLDNDIYLEVTYSIPGKDGELKYRIKLCEVESNLGAGRVIYFQCPQTGRRCRILYKAYGSEIFKSRTAYRHRLYYDCQIASKLNKYNDMYWRIEKHLESISRPSKRGSRKYKGKPTKAANRFNKLYDKQIVLDELRWTLGVPKSLQGKIDDIR